MNVVNLFLYDSRGKQIMVVVGCTSAKYVGIVSWTVGIDRVEPEHVPGKHKLVLALDPSGKHGMPRMLSQGSIRG